MESIEKDFTPIICGETCGCKARVKECLVGKGNQLNTPLVIDETKKENAITYEQILTLAYNEHGHKYQPGYDNDNGNYNYFGTSKDAMRNISVNAEYVGHTFVRIEKDGGTRCVFNGHVRSFEELKLINDLVL